MRGGACLAAQTAEGRCQWGRAGLCLLEKQDPRGPVYQAVAMHAEPGSAGIARGRRGAVSARETTLADDNVMVRGLGLRTRRVRMRSSEAPIADESQRPEARLRPLPPEEPLPAVIVIPARTASRSRRAARCGSRPCTSLWSAPWLSSAPAVGRVACLRAQGLQLSIWLTEPDDHR